MPRHQLNKSLLVPTLSGPRQHRVRRGVVRRKVFAVVGLHGSSPPGTRIGDCKQDAAKAGLVTGLLDREQDYTLYMSHKL
jgi:hypothetical protein